MNNFWRFFVFAGMIGTAAALRAAAPFVTNTQVSQDASTFAVTVSYSLEAPAIVTVRFFTNAVDGLDAAVAIPDAIVTNLTGDVCRYVGTTGTHTFVWYPTESDFPKKPATAPDFRAQVCAWSTKAPPPIMVCDLVAPSNTTYYPSVDALPGGLLANDDYRTTKLVLKKVEACRETWTRGSTGESGRGSAEQAHAVMLTNDYYLGVFEFTQAQYTNVNPFAHAFTWKGGKRPADGISYRYLRDGYASDASHPERCYPAEPISTMFLGKLRARTGQAFDIPSESQWEYAARGGYGDGFWGNGMKITATGTCPNLTPQARYKANGYADNGDGTVTTNGTADVGSYQPNALGFYDMAGNVSEWCLDWGQGSDFYCDLSENNGRDVTGLAGAVNAIGNRVPAGVVTKKAGFDLCSRSYEIGDLLIGQDRSCRGGCWSDSASACRPRCRNWMHYSYDMGSISYRSVGFRVALTLNAPVSTDQKIVPTESAIKVGVYVGVGAELSGVCYWEMLTTLSPDIEPTFLDEKLIAAGRLDGLDVLVMPGGESSLEYSKLNSVGAIAKVKDFIRAGGGFVGTCAGNCIVLNESNRMCIAPYEYVEGGSASDHGTALLAMKFNSKARSLCGIAAKSRFVRYSGGPVMCPGEPVEGANISSIATYDCDLVCQYGSKLSVVPMRGYDAALGGTYGKGRVFVIATHPEYRDDTLDILEGAFRYTSGRKQVRLVRPHREVGDLSVAVYGPGMLGVADANMIAKMTLTPGLDIVFVNQKEEIGVGALDHVDALVLPAGGVSLYKRHMSTVTQTYIKAFANRGGKVFAVGTGVSYAPEGAVVCTTHDELVEKLRNVR